MLDWLNANVLWWHWIILGFIFIGLETVTMTFLMLGIGVAAILTGLAALLLHLSFAAELLVWSVLSLLFVVGWWRFIRQRTVTQSGQPHYRVDTKGTVVEAVTPQYIERAKELISPEQVQRILLYMVTGMADLTDGIPATNAPPTEGVPVPERKPDTVSDLPIHEQEHTPSDAA